MKSEIRVLVDTNNMARVYSTDDPAEFNRNNEITSAIEEQIHNAVIAILRYHLGEESLNELIINDCIPDFEFLGVDGWTEINDYGSLKITMDNPLTKEKEILANVVRTKVDEDIEEVPDEKEKLIEEEEVIPEMQLEDDVVEEEEEEVLGIEEDAVVEEDNLDEDV
jgi:hypothetical protein